MSKVSHLPKNVPVKELPFKIKVKGATTKHQYVGDFVVEVPNAKKMLKIGIELAKLNDGVPFDSLDRNTANLNNAIAFLRVCLKEAPAWFTNDSDDADEEGMEYGLETMDINIPIHVFTQATKATKAWHDALKGQPGEPEEAKA